MPLIVLALLAVLVVAAMGMWLTLTLVHMLLTFAVAGFVGWLADLVVPGELPYGWLGAVAAGLVGGWIGALLIGNVGPALLGIHLLPAFVGAALVAAAAQLVGKAVAKRTAGR